MSGHADFDTGSRRGTAQALLTAEMLGDIGKLHAEVGVLRGELPATLSDISAATLHLRTAVANASILSNAPGNGASVKAMLETEKRIGEMLQRIEGIPRKPAPESANQPTAQTWFASDWIVAAAFFAIFAVGIGIGRYSISEPVMSAAQAAALPDRTSTNALARCRGEVVPINGLDTCLQTPTELPRRPAAH